MADHSEERNIAKLVYEADVRISKLILAVPHESEEFSREASNTLLGVVRVLDGTLARQAQSPTLSVAAVLEDHFKNLEEKHPLLDSPHIKLTSDSIVISSVYEYAIPLSRLKNASEMLALFDHLAHKIWFTPRLERQLREVINSALLRNFDLTFYGLGTKSLNWVTSETSE